MSGERLSRVGSWWASVVLCAAVAAVPMAHAAPLPFDGSAYSFYANDTPVAKMLAEFCANFGIQLQIDPSIATRVSGRLGAPSASEFLNTVTASAGLDWFYYAGAIHVTRVSERDTQVHAIARETIPGLRNALLDLKILEERFGWAALADQGMVVVSGPPVSTGQAFVASLTIMALVLTVLDCCSAISKECGGPDISYAGLVALVMEAFGSSKAAADAVRQWLGLTIQIGTSLVGAVGGYSAVAKMSDVMKWMNAIVSIASGATSVAGGVTSIVAAKERYRLIETQVNEMQAQAFHEVLLASVKRWADDLQNFRDDLDEALRQRSDWLTKEHALSVRVATA